jgi:hypothetical protein
MRKLNVKLDFFIIGAAKSGTTWLSTNLSKHPALFIPEEKELGYFCERNYLYPFQKNPLYLSNNERIESYFSHATSEQLLGEGTTSYLWDPKAPKNLFQHNNDAKLIAILRNPIERIISHYRFWLQLGIIPNRNILEIIEERPEMLELGNYSIQLKRYFDIFPANQLLVLLFDDLMIDHNQVLIAAEEFLGVENYVPEGTTQIVNLSGQARFWFLNRSISKIKNWIRDKGIDYDRISYISKRIGLGSPLNRLRRMNKSNTKRQQILGPAETKFLYEYYSEDIFLLEKIINRDLSSWIPNTSNIAFEFLL